MPVAGLNKELADTHEILCPSCPIAIAPMLIRISCLCLCLLYGQAGFADPCQLRRDDQGRLWLYDVVKLLEQPDCAQPAQLHLADIEARIARGEFAGFALGVLERPLALAKLRFALWNGELVAVRTQLQELLRLHLREHQLLRDPNVADALLVSVMLDQPDLRPRSPVVLSPAGDWTVHYGHCGMPAEQFRKQATLSPGLPDVMMAMGQPQQALQVLLHEQWVRALNHGLTPPRLRQFAEAADPKLPFEIAVEQALASITIIQTQSGREAYLQFHGQYLPVPLAVDYGEMASRFHAPAEIADYLRPFLLGRR